MALKKMYYADGKNCKVTFSLSNAICGDFKKINLVGGFNNWNEKATPMEKRKNGSFSVSLVLQAGCEYQYRYLADESIWLNDDKADKYVPAPHGVENSVVSL
jgi:1,4-alpha-glucan branching enzyme